MDDQLFVQLAAVRASTADLLAGLDAERWSDDDMAAPSLLPDWTRGHVLTHVARNADGIARTLSGALRGEQLARYPDGKAGRNADIEHGAHRLAAEQLADVRDSAARLDAVFGAVADADGWELPAEHGKPAHTFVRARWREVEIHRLDMSGRYGAADWPADFVEYLLPKLADTVGTRAARSLRIQVTRDRSVSATMPGRSWDIGAEDPVAVEGPDWALLGWLIGRPAAVGGALTATPELAPWS